MCLWEDLFLVPISPKNLNSFLYTGLHHLCTLQTHGLCIWDFQRGQVFTSQPFFFLGTADGPGLAAVHGQAGYHGACGCHEYCGLRGQNKLGGPHYYPTLLKPTNYALPGCDHDDVNVYNLPKPSAQRYIESINNLMQCKTDAQFRLTWKASRSVQAKQASFLALIQSIVLGFPGAWQQTTCMLWPSTCLTYLSLWLGTIDCDHNDARPLWD